MSIWTAWALLVITSSTSSKLEGSCQAYRHNGDFPSRHVLRSENVVSVRVSGCPSALNGEVAAIWDFQATTARRELCSVTPSSTNSRRPCIRVSSVLSPGVQLPKYKVSSTQTTVVVPSTETLDILCLGVYKLRSVMGVAQTALVTAVILSG